MNLKNKLKFPLLVSMLSCKMPTSQWSKPRNTLVMPTTQKLKLIGSMPTMWQQRMCRAFVWCRWNYRTRWFWSTWYEEENPSHPLCAWEWCSNVGCLLGNAVDMYRVCPSRFGSWMRQLWLNLEPETKYPIIDIMRDQIDVEDMGNPSFGTLPI